MREFLTWFQSEYRTRRHGADYLVKWDKHGTLVKQMLGATYLAAVLLKFAMISYLLGIILTYGAFALLIVFQPERGRLSHCYGDSVPGGCARCASPRCRSPAR